MCNKILIKKEKGFVRTVEAIIAGLIVFAYLSFFHFQVSKVQGLNKEKYSSIENLLIVASTSNASYVLIHAFSQSSTRMLRDILPTHEKIQFYLENLPKKEIKIGIWINDSNVEKVKAIPCKCVSPLSGTCDCFDFLGFKGVINNYTYIGIDENGDGVVNLTELHLPYQLVNLKNKGVYAFGKFLEENNYLSLDVLNITPYYFLFEDIPSMEKINGKTFFIYKIPVYYGSILTPIDVLLFYNTTYPINKYYAMIKDYAYEGGGIFLFSNITFSKLSYYVSKIFGIHWSPSKPLFLNTQYVAIISNNITPTSTQYFFKKYFYSEAIIKPTIPVKNANYSGLDVSEIPYAESYGMIGSLIINGEFYPFLLLNSTPYNYNELFISFNHNYNFSDEKSDYTPIYTGNVFNVGKIEIQFEECSRLGLRGCFYLIKPVKFYNVSIPDIIHNDIVLFSNRVDENVVYFPNLAAYNISNKLVYHIPLEVLIDHSGIYKSGWLPLINISDDLNLHLLTSSLVWTSREWNANTGVEYKSKLYVPILWYNRTLLFGRGALVAW